MLCRPLHTLTVTALCSGRRTVSTMSSAPVLLARLVATAHSVAEKSGTIVRNIMSAGDLGIVEKTGANDLQTAADRLVQQSICASLARKFPLLTIIGEEDLPSEEVSEDVIESGQSEEILKVAFPSQYSGIKEEELVVWVDPLDGTKEYTEGLLDHVTVLIGIAYEGKAIAGVINQPYYNYQAGDGAVLGRTIWGVLGVGAFGFDLKEVPEGQHIVTTTRSHSSKLVNDCIAAINPDKVVRVGGAGNKIIQLIEGQASAYVFASPGCKKWDTCAPEAILHAVGGGQRSAPGWSARHDASSTWRTDMASREEAPDQAQRHPSDRTAEQVNIIKGKLTDIGGNAYEYHKDVKHMNAAGVLATLRNFNYYSSRVPESVKQALVPKM